MPPDAALAATRMQSREGVVEEEEDRRGGEGGGGTDDKGFLSGVFESTGGIFG